MSSFADRTSELWLQIDQLHLKYLQHDDNVLKVSYSASGSISKLALQQGDNELKGNHSFPMVTCLNTFKKFITDLLKCYPYVQIDLRKKLERLVKEYLCLVPQDRKFVATSTGDIINNSVR